jgi:hypothetical protein
MLQQIEKADLKCELGAVFEVATIVGVNLFNAQPSSFTMARHSGLHRNALLDLFQKSWPDIVPVSKRSDLNLVF